MESEKACELYVDEVLAGDGSLLHFDKISSVSGLELEREPCVIWDQQVLDAQERSFHNGT